MSDFPKQLLTANASIQRLAFSLAGGDASGDDLAQEAWLAALERRPHEGLRDPDAWWGTVIRNAARNLRRGQRRRDRRERAVARPEVDPAAGPFDLAVFEERRRELVAAIEELPVRHRDVVVARYWQGLEPHEIAARSGKTSAAVRQRLRRALQTLRDRLDHDGDRRAWLAPLFVGMSIRDEVVPTAVAATAVTGGLLVKKVVMAVAALLLFVFGGFALVSSMSGASAGGSPSEPKRSASVSGPAAGQVDPTPVASRREVRGAPEVLTAAPARRLLQVDGSPAAGVTYWFDERPFPSHPAVPPPNAPRTGHDGAFAMDTVPEVAGSGGEWLWFRIGIEAFVAVPRAELAGLDRVELFVPHSESVALEIRGLPADEAWRFIVFPAFADPDGDGVDALTHAMWHVEPAPEPALPGAKLLRRQFDRRGMAGPARTAVSVVAGLPYAFRFESPGYEINPDLQELVPAGAVVAHAAAHRPVYPFEILEADGATPSDIGGCFSVVRPRTTSTWTFEGGRGELQWQSDKSHAEAVLTVVLEDGEAFALPLDDPRFRDHNLLQLTRGTGMLPVRRVAVEDEVFGWPELDIHWLSESGRIHDAVGLETFAPTADWVDVGVWRAGNELVVQTSRRTRPVGPLLAVAGDGRVAREIAGRLVPMPSAAMESLEAEALIERFAGEATRRLTVRHSIQLPGVVGREDDGWLLVGVRRFRVIPDFGWRLTQWNGDVVHERLPALIPMFAPVGVASRWTVDDGEHEVHVPHGVLR